MWGNGSGLLGAGVGGEAADVVRVVKTKAVDQLCSLLAAAAALAVDKHRRVSASEYIECLMNAAERNVDAAGDMALSIFLCLAHIDQYGVFGVVKQFYALVDIRSVEEAKAHVSVPFSV